KAAHNQLERRYCSAVYGAATSRAVTVSPWPVAKRGDAQHWQVANKGLSLAFKMQRWSHEVPQGADSGSYAYILSVVPESWSHLLRNATDPPAGHHRVRSRQCDCARFGW